MSQQNQPPKKSPFGTENFERKKPSTLRILIMTAAVAAVLIAIGYFFGT